MSDEKINSEVRELVYQKGKFDFNKKIIEEIQDKKFNSSKFNELVGYNREYGSINSVNDNELFEINSVKMLFALPTNSFALVNNSENKIYLVKIIG